MARDLDGITGITCTRVAHGYVFGMSAQCMAS
jgi:hypothetical protein